MADSEEHPRFTIGKFKNFVSIIFHFWVMVLFSLTWETPISGENFWVFWTPFTQKWLTIDQTPQRHFLTPNHAFWAIIRICATSVVSCRLVEEIEKKTKKTYDKLHGKCYISPICGGAPFHCSDPIFGTWDDLDDVMKYPKPHLSISRGFRTTRVGILGPPIGKPIRSYNSVDANAQHGDCCLLN